MNIEMEKMMDAIAASKNWVEQVVIAHNFCPFAKRELDRGRVHFAICSDTKTEQALETVVAECERLDRFTEEPDKIETTLIIFENMLKSFDEFLDFADMASELLELQGYAGVYQLASFHPDYCFEGEDDSDAANYTNRSPLPMLHLIREDSMEQALGSFPEPETIPEKNIQHARSLGKPYFQRLLEVCKNNTEENKNDSADGQ